MLKKNGFTVIDSFLEMNLGKDHGVGGNCRKISEFAEGYMEYPALFKKFFIFFNFCFLLKTSVLFVCLLF